MGSPPKVSHAASRRKSLAQQIEGAEERAAAIPSLSPRSPHLGRASRSPKTKSTAVLSSSLAASGDHAEAVHGHGGAAAEVPRITTEDLAHMLHGGDGGPPSPTQSAVVTPVPGLSDQLKEAKAVAHVPLSPKRAI